MQIAKQDLSLVPQHAMNDLILMRLSITSNAGDRGFISGHNVISLLHCSFVGPLPTARNLKLVTFSRISRHIFSCFVHAISVNDWDYYEVKVVSRNPFILSVNRARVLKTLEDYIDANMMLVSKSRRSLSKSWLPVPFKWH